MGAKLQDFGIVVAGDVTVGVGIVVVVDAHVVEHETRVRIGVPVQAQRQLFGAAPGDVLVAEIELAQA